MSRIQGNFHVAGKLTSESMSIPSGTVNNSAVASDAALAASKLQQHHCATYHEGSGTNATDKTVILHKVKGANGTLKSFRVDCVSACTGAATVTVDLQKNGVSVLDAVITLNSGTTAATGTITSDSVVANDKLTAVIDATISGTDAAAAGLFVELRVDEAYPT
jgi:hypothetical protein